MTPLLHAHGLRREEQGRVLLAGVNLHLDAGERVVLSGPSGAGKSVLLRALALLDPLQGGQLHWHGQPLAPAGIPAFRSQVCYLAQRPALLEGNGWDNLRFPFSLRSQQGKTFDATAALRLLAWAAARRQAVRAGMIPTLNQMSLPGMMTGQVLAGQPPGDAVRYQIVIMFLVAAASALGTVGAVLLGWRGVFSRAHCFLRQRLG